jgi:AraC-like DNA-binding protein
LSLLESHHTRSGSGGNVMPFTVTRTEFSDFEALQHVLPDGCTDVALLGRGRMSGTLMHAALGSSFGISSGFFSRGVRLRGVLSDRRWMLGMLLATDGAASSLQHELAVGDLAIIAPGQERYSVYQGASRFAAALISYEELDGFLATQPGVLDSPVWRQPATVRAADPAGAATKIKQMSMLIATLSEHGSRLSDQTADFYKRNILELLTAPVRDMIHHQDRLPRSYLTLVREVDRYLADVGNRPIHISELCEQFNVHRRALHRAFMAVLGMPPITFLRRKRLGEVHTALLMGGPATIKQIAIEHGFAELGRFAGCYRRMFGELPSETRQRRIRP